MKQAIPFRRFLPGMFALFANACFVLLLAFAASPAFAATDAAQTPSLSPEEAQRAIAVLQDPDKRAQALAALRAIADAAPASATSAEPPASATADTTAPASATASTSAPAAASTSKAPLEKNGLIAQMLRQIDSWSDTLVDQMRQVSHAMLGVPALVRQLSAQFSASSGHALLLDLLKAVVLVMAGGLALEWLLNRILRRPRSALIAHAPHMTRDHAIKPADANLAQESAMRPPTDKVALVQTHRDGVDHLEAVPVEPKPAPGVPASDAMHGKSSEHNARISLRKAGKSLGEHWSRLRRLPLALAVLGLDLVQVAAFFVVAALILHWIGGQDERATEVARAFINAYVSTRVTMAVFRLLIAPPKCGVPMLHISPALATTVYRWIRRIVILATFGTALADAVTALGAGDAGRLAVLKIVSLFVHLFTVILIFRIRRNVGAVIAAPPHAEGPLASARNWFATSWAYFASVLVIGVWVVWALGVEDGFPRLIRFIGVTAAVILGARLLSIVMSGALSRTFHRENGDADDSANHAHQLDRYYPIVHWLVSAAIAVCTVVVLLQLWGFDAIDWLARGTVGRKLLSAVVTIAVAAFAAVVIWEAVNASIKRRLSYWDEQGEVVRVARMRTLLPMVRTSLFIAILLVVGLTALSEIGVNTTPLLAGASIFGVALGFGSQKLVQDFITGIFLLLENAMQVGDWVTVAGVSGVVEYLSIRTVRLRAGDGSLHIVPFSSVTTVNNTNRGLGNASMRVTVTYGVDVDQVTNELKSIGAGLRSDPAFKDQILNDIEVWGVDAVDGSTVTFAGQMRCTDKGRWGVQRELNRRILERFRQLGIQIADPRTMLLLPGESVPPVTSSAQNAVTGQPKAEQDAKEV
ncbi:MAG TPA: mechanosensitive ion channel domain-containing protein [Oxalicibacterium sp.]|nr:mechanosensitive ion channel domain-containing protein [Oxalicibacterium sp.]